MSRRFTITLLALGVALALAAVPHAEAAPPSVVGSWPTGVGSEAVTLRAEIKPEGSATTYLFEYTPEADFRTKGFIDAVKVPQVAVGISTNGLVFQRLGDLPSDTAFRFRVVASHAGGEASAIGKVRSFRTDPLAPLFTLPDGRGWEMVSPLDKNGGEIQAAGRNHGGGVLQAATQGGALTYTSASSFSRPLGSPGPNQYVSTRDPGGWSTENVSLPMLSGTYPESPTSGVPYQLFSSDLAGALVSNGRRCRTSAETQCPVENPPLPGSGAPPGYRNYYLRSGAGAFAAILKSAPATAAPNFELAFAGATPDLGHVVISTCTALTSNATEVPGPEGECDPAAQNLYEVSGSQIRLINLEPGAALAAQSRAISTDGSRIYYADATGLHLADGSSQELVSTTGTFQTASLDGSLAFYSDAGHLFRYSAATETSTDLTPTGGVQGVIGASDDGSYVYILNSSGLVLLRNGATIAVAPQTDPNSAPPSSGSARLTADGHRLLFLSSAEDLTAYDNRNAKTGLPEPEAYLYAAPGTAGAGITCVSCNPSGERPVGPAELPGANPNGAGPFAQHSYKPRLLSADGKRVFFDSHDSLSVADTNGDRDVYEWEAQGVGSCARVSGCVELISSGRAEGGASFLDASADGSDAFFLTDGSLVRTDSALVDIYDARVGGGFPESTSAIPCFGDACQPLPPAPQAAPLGSVRSKPSGNAKTIKFRRLHCKRNQIKKLGRCIKKPKKHHKKKGPS